MYPPATAGGTDLIGPNLETWNMEPETRNLKPELETVSVVRQNRFRRKPHLSQPIPRL